MRLKFTPIVCLLFAVPAVAQTPVVGITVHIVNQKQDTITYQVTNQSAKPVSAFTVGIDTAYADGQSFHSESSIQARPIQPGAFVTYTKELTNPAHGKVLNVSMTPVMVIYTDQSSEAVDQTTYHRFVDPLVGRRKALEVAQQAVQQSLANGSDPRPAIQDALKQSKLATTGPHPGVKRFVVGQPVPPDDTTLEQILADLQNVKTPADMAAYANKLQQQLQHTPIGGK